MAAKISAAVKRIELSETASEDEDIPTPATQEGESAWGDEDDIVASWQLAIKQCRESLSEFEFAELQRFTTPEKLADDLRKKEASRPNFAFVRRPIRTMKGFLTFFVVTMAPRTLQSSIFWGLFYLLIELADDQKNVRNRWKATLEMLEKVARSLEACKRSHQDVPFDEDMKLTLNDAFMDLIQLWAETIAFMRNDPYGSEVNNDDDIPSKFNKAIKKVDESFSYLKECAAARDASAKRTTFASEEASLKSLLPEGLALPCGGAPHYSDETFFGRQEELDRLDQVLSPDSSRDQRFCTVYGLGGVGKSKLAMAYAKRYGHKFEVTLWIASQNLVSLKQSFIEAAVALRIPGVDKDGNADKNRDILFDYLKKHGRRWLIIWDNVEYHGLIRPYLSTTTTAASMLVTTRYPEQAQFLRSRGQLIHLEPLSPSESQQLFAKMLGPEYYNAPDSEERKASEILVDRMGGLPIGICTMAIRIRAKDLSIQNFLNLYRKGKLTSSGEAELVDYDLSLEMIWNDTFSSLQFDPAKAQTEAFVMLGVLAFCSPSTIHRELFIGPSLTKLPNAPRFCQSLEEYLEAIGKLRESGLITADRDSRTITIHRLVQSAFQIFLGFEARQTAFDLTVRLVHSAFPKQVEGRPMHLQWTQCHMFIQHGVLLADVYEDSHSTAHPLQAPEELGELLSQCVWYLYEINEHSEALRIANITLKLVEKDTYLYGHLNNSMYSMYWSENNLGGARIHLDVALRSMKDKIGEVSEEYIGIMGNEGNLLTAEGKTDAALAAFSKAEQYRKQHNHPQNLGQAFLNLGIGRLELQKGNLEEAENRFRKASEIVVEHHGIDGPYMQDVHYAIGNLQLRRGNYLLAEESYSRALKLQENENEDHIFVASFLYKKACARILMKQVNTNEDYLKNTKDLLDRALNIALLRKSEGDEARILIKLAELQRLMGSMPDAPDVVTLEKRAKDLKDQVEKTMGLDQLEGTENVSEEEEYSRLVCIFHR